MLAEKNFAEKKSDQHLSKSLYKSNVDDYIIVQNANHLFIELDWLEELIEYRLQNLEAKK